MFGACLLVAQTLGMPFLQGSVHSTPVARHFAEQNAAATTFMPYQTNQPNGLLSPAVSIAPAIMTGEPTTLQNMQPTSVVVAGQRAPHAPYKRPLSAHTHRKIGGSVALSPRSTPTPTPPLKIAAGPQGHHHLMPMPMPLPKDYSHYNGGETILTPPPTPDVTSRIA